MWCCVNVRRSWRRARVRASVDHMMMVARVRWVCGHSADPSAVAPAVLQASGLPPLARRDARPVRTLRSRLPSWLCARVVAHSRSPTPLWRVLQSRSPWPRGWRVLQSRSPQLRWGRVLLLPSPPPRGSALRPPQGRPQSWPVTPRGWSPPLSLRPQWAPARCRSRAHRLPVLIGRKRLRCRLVGRPS